MPPSYSLYPHRVFTVNSYSTRPGDTTLVKRLALLCYSGKVMAQDYLNGLNAAQKEAVLHTDGPLLLIAGAGAGKTKTISHRMAHLMASGVPARQLLGITFTNKAASEMRERVRVLVPNGAPLLTTFHSFGVRMLREFHQEAGVPTNFSIWDRDDSIKALKSILEGLGLSSISPRSALSAISREKGKGISASEYIEQAANFRARHLAQAWERYEKTLAEERALDFDDLLLATKNLLVRSPKTLALLQDRYRYLTIDEYQDTNGVQMDIARLLAGEKKNICAVGDVDQNIYSWRGADITHLLAFEETFPGTRTILLEQNYRSTRTILAVANSIIEKNVRRKPKKLFTENETGEPIVLYPAQNEIDEAWFVAEHARRLIESGTRASNIAVLYRENFQSRGLEEAFLHLDVPYRVLGTRFFERKEVKDLLSYLRAALNPESKNDLRRIITTPPRGIGRATLEKIFTGFEADLGAAMRVKVSKFKETLESIRKSIDILPASEAVRFAFEISGMEAMFQKKSAEEHERLENIQELVNFATRYDSLAPAQGIAQLLEEAALQSDQDELDQEVAAVSLMTVHASKGLEFDAVFITGLEQGLFPSSYGDDTRDPEEERRLFYVALTRARKRLYISFARERMKYGSREYMLPSEFLDDIDRRLIEYANAKETHEKEEIIR